MGSEMCIRDRLYVGTTDGAVWMTKNGGQEWIALYQEKQEAKPEEKKEGDGSKKADAETDKGGESSSDEEAMAEGKAEGNAVGNAAGQGTASLNGTWNGRIISDRFPEGQAPTISLMLKADENGKVTGEIETRRGAQDITEGNFNSETGELMIVIETQRGRREFEVKLKDLSLIHI